MLVRGRVRRRGLAGVGDRVGARVVARANARARAHASACIMPHAPFEFILIFAARLTA